MIASIKRLDHKSERGGSMAACVAEMVITP